MYAERSAYANAAFASDITTVLLMHDAVADRETLSATLAHLLKS